MKTESITHWSDLHGTDFHGRQCLVTGGAGFIGSHLTGALLELGAKVSVLDDLSGGDWANVRAVSDSANGPFKAADKPSEQDGPLTLWEGSIQDPEMVNRAMAGAEYVFHLAALGSVPRSIKMPEKYVEVNIVGTTTVLEAAREQKIKRLVFSSSSSVYGETEELPKHETMPMLALSPYAASKIAGEALVRSYAKCYEMDASCLRYFNVFGPRQNANSAYAAVIAAFCKHLKNGDSPIVFGDGEQSRDFTYVDNVVHANLLAAKSAKPLEGAATNVACARRITINELADALKDAYGRPDTPTEFKDARVGDILHSLASLDRTEQLLNYQPIVDFETGLRQTVLWAQSA